jgi:heme/copper-type cytochrome/quinol oxidase subunit 2
MVKIDFEKTDGVYTLQDALHLPDDHNFSESDIEVMKQQRFDNWMLVITAPAPEPTPEPTPEETPPEETPPSEVA